PRDVNIKSKEISGKMFIDGKWMEKTIHLPKLIDISPYCFKVKNRKTIQYLKRNCYLTDNNENSIDKEKLQKLLSKDKHFMHIAVPTKRLDCFESILGALEEFKTIVIKPVSRGSEDTYILTKYRRKYMLDDQKSKKKVISKNELYSFFRTMYSKDYIIQKYISSCSKTGDPFDCRIHFEKNGLGNWEVAKMYIRMAVDQKVVSNIKQESGMAHAKQFLKANFVSKWNDIYTNLKNIAKTFPYKFESFRKTNIMSLCINIGIEKDGKLYIFGANNAPSTYNVLAEVVDLRTQYYKYLFENIVDIEIKKKRNIKLSELAGRKFVLSDRLVIREAYRRGVNFKILPNNKFKMTFGESSHIIHPGMIAFSYNSETSNRIALMKDETNKLLRSNGYPAPENIIFNTVEQAWEWAKINLPVVLKPIDGQMGKLVFVKLDNYIEFKKCFEKILEKHENVLVERFKTGQEYRFAFVNNEIVAIARRIPANVVGNGKNTIKELMEQKNKERKRRKNPIHKLLVFNSETERVLEKGKKDYEYVPSDGEIIYLRNNSNISTGGDA